jgi:hypothetical protein
MQKNMMTFRLFSLLLAMVAFLSCNQAQPGYEAREVSGPILSLEGDTLTKVDKSQDEWKAELSPQAFTVLRKQGTERAFTGEYWNNKNMSHPVFFYIVFRNDITSDLALIIRWLSVVS